MQTLDFFVITTIIIFANAYHNTRPTFKSRQYSRVKENSLAAPVELDRLLEKDNRNQDLMLDIVDHFQNESRGNVQLPPGWGKTNLALETVATLCKTGEVESILYVTPMLKLVDQVFDHMDRFDTLSGLPISTLIVASQTNRKGTQCTTSPQDIAKFWSDSILAGKVPLIVSTYKSLARVGEALHMLEYNESFSFALFDEAHSMEGRGLESSYGLFDENISIDKRLFLTATPYNFTDSKKIQSKLQKASINRDPVRSINNEEIFGKCIVRKSLHASVEENVTVPVTLCALSRQEIYDLLALNNANDFIDNEEKRDQILHFAVKAAFEKLNISHAVSFHSTNNQSRAFVKTAEKVFNDNDNDCDIRAFCVDGTMRAKKREEILAQAMEASKSVVCNCKLLQEGVDQADWEMVVMADPVQSRVKAQQMIGRVTRKAIGKERGYVLVPCLVDDMYDESGYVLSKSKAYQVFVTAFEAMVALDPELRQEVLSSYTQNETDGRGQEGREVSLRIREAFMLPSSMSLDVKLNIMTRAIVEVGGNEIYWEKMYKQLVEYKNRHGHCDVPMRQFKLGNWLNRQRQMKKKGTLDVFRERQLEGLGVKWNILDELWESNFLLLKQFKQREGHCNVPQWHKEDDQSLGVWLKNQRNRRETLDSERISRLEQLGVNWKFHDEVWESNFLLLKQFKQREGHCDVPSWHKEDGQRLGVWLKNQRNRRKTLDSERISRLEQLGVSWNLIDEKWNSYCALLKEFKQREGHCIIPKRKTENGINLGYWLDYQRKCKRRGTLDSERISRLEEIGVIWDPLGKK